MAAAVTPEGVPWKFVGAALPISLRLERPLSAGTGHDLHHLHLNELEVFDRAGTRIALSPVDASPQVKEGQDGRAFGLAIDGNPATSTHSKYGQIWPRGGLYATEDHWMEFELVRPHGPVQWIRVQSSHPAWLQRAPGAFLELRVDGVRAWRYDFSAQSVAADAYLPVQLAETLRLERPLSAGTGHDLHHLHLNELEVFDRAGTRIALSPVDASPQVKEGQDGRAFGLAIDGNPATSTHSKYGQIWPRGGLYATEDHWMEFELVRPHGPVQWIRVQSSHPAWLQRAPGAFLELRVDGVRAWRHTFAASNIGNELRVEICGAKSLRPLPPIPAVQRVKLFHGTNGAFSEPITATGLRMSQPGSARIGVGVYFTPDYETAKQIALYCTGGQRGGAAIPESGYEDAVVFECDVVVGRQYDYDNGSAYANGVLAPRSHWWANVGFGSAFSKPEPDTDHGHPPWAGIGHRFHEVCVHNVGAVDIVKKQHIGYAPVNACNPNCRGECGCQNEGCKEKSRCVVACPQCPHALAAVEPEPEMAI